MGGGGADQNANFFGNLCLPEMRPVKSSLNMAKVTKEGGRSRRFSKNPKGSYVFVGSLLSIIIILYVFFYYSVKCTTLDPYTYSNISQYRGGKQTQTLTNRQYK